MFSTPRLGSILTTNDVGQGRAIDTPELWKEHATDIFQRFLDMTGGIPEDLASANCCGLRPKPLPLAFEVHEETETEAYLRRLVSYLVEPDERVQAYVLIPRDYLGNVADAPSGPAVLCLHQTASDGKKEPVGLSGPDDMAYAHHLALRGYVCIAPDHVAAGDRVAPGANAYDTTEFYRKRPAWSAVGKAMWDARRAVDALHTLPQVDQERIGVIGHSLGGHSAVFAAATDSRIRACVSNCGMTTFAENERRLDWSRENWYVYFPMLRALFENDQPAPVDFHEIAALIAPRPFLNITSLTDDVMGVPDTMYEFAARVREVYRLLGAQDQFASHFHDLGHGFPTDMRELAYGWLDRALAVELSVE